MKIVLVTGLSKDAGKIGKMRPGMSASLSAGMKTGMSAGVIVALGGNPDLLMISRITTSISLSISTERIGNVTGMVKRNKRASVKAGTSVVQVKDLVGCANANPDGP